MIFLNLLNRIFGPKKPLSRQEIDDYKKGEGNLHEVESKASSSDFDGDALEGWNESEMTVDEGMHSSDSKMEGFTNKTPGNPSKNNGGLFLSFALFTVAMVLLIIFTYQGNETFEEQTQITQDMTTAPSRIDEVDFYKGISTEKQITATNLIPSIDKSELRSQDGKSNTLTITENKITDDQLKDDEDEQINLPVKSKNEISNNTSKDNLIYYDAKEIYIFDLKNVDYRAYRNRPIQVDINLDIGTPANQATKDDQQEMPITQKKDVPYIDFLTNTAELFSQGEYKLALKRYLTILETYPDDVNANFYGGLCYYNLGQFEKAEELLKQSFAVGYGNFRQEAMWFGAKANYELKNDIKARYLLKKIIKEDGFYAQQAKDLLEQLK